MILYKVVAIFSSHLLPNEKTEVSGAQGGGRETCEFSGHILSV